MKLISLYIRGKKALFIKFLFSYIIIGITLLGFMSSFLYIKFTQGSIEDINRFSKKSLEQSVRAFNTLWNTTYLNMNKEFRRNSSIVKGLNLTEYDPIDSYEVTQRLNDLVEGNKIFQSVCIYNKTANLIFSSIGTTTQIDNFYDKNFVRDLLGAKAELSEITNSMIVYREFNYTNGVKSESKKTIAVAFSDNNFESALIFNIDSNILQELIFDDDYDGTEYMIINEKGIILSNKDQSSIFKDISKEDFIQKIISNNDISGNFIDKAFGKKSLVAFKRWDKWDMMGWVIICINDYNKLFDNIGKIRNDVLISTFILILICFGISILLAGNFYAPVRKIINKLSDNKIIQPDKAGNEYALIENAYDQLILDNSNLKKYKSNSHMALKKELLGSVVNGTIVNNLKMQEIIYEEGFLVNAEKFIALVFQIDNAKSIMLSNIFENMALLRFSIANITEELIGEQFSIEAVDTGENTVCALLWFDNGEVIDLILLNDCIKKVQEACQKHLNVSLTVGIGSVEENIKEINYSYRNAIEASTYRYVKGKGSITSYKDIAGNNVIEYKYPYNLEKTILNAIKNADENKVHSALNEFFDVILMYNVDEISLAISQLITITFRTINIYFHDENKSDLIATYSTQSIFEKFETIYELKDWLLLVYLEAIDIQRKKKENKYDDIVARIQSYITNNYSDINISVDDVAQRVGLSPNYVRTLFKDFCGISLSTYINEVRFNKAKEMLLSTSEPASKIAEMVGFPGGGYFYTSFKKFVGVSPEEFRKSGGI